MPFQKFRNISLKSVVDKVPTTTRCELTMGSAIMGGVEVAMFAWIHGVRMPAVAAPRRS